LSDIFLTDRFDAIFVESSGDPTAPGMFFEYMKNRHHYHICYEWGGGTTLKRWQWANERIFSSFDCFKPNSKITPLLIETYTDGWTAFTSTSAHRGSKTSFGLRVGNILTGLADDFSQLILAGKEISDATLWHLFSTLVLTFLFKLFSFVLSRLFDQLEAGVDLPCVSAMKKKLEFERFKGIFYVMRTDMMAAYGVANTKGWSPQSVFV